MQENKPKRNEGLYFYCVLDKKGGASFFSSWRTLAENWQKEDFVWAHLNHKNISVKQWLRDESGIPSVVAEALVEEDTRPRGFAYEDGLFFVLRSLNLKEGSEPEDMVSMRIWIDKKHILTLRHRENLTTRSIQEELIDQKGFRNQSEFLLKIIDRVVEPIDDEIDEMEEQLDELEETLILGKAQPSHASIIRMRQRIAHFRKHLAPQRDFLLKLAREPIPWLEEKERLFIHEQGDTLIRYVETLDFLRERCVLIQEEINNALNYEVNSRIYLLAIVAGIFLPLSLITGLLGINVEGIPFAKSPYAFASVCGVLFLIALFLFRFLKRRRWL